MRGADRLVATLKTLRDTAAADAELERAGSHEWVLAKGRVFGLEDAIAAVRDQQLAELNRRSQIEAQS